MEEILEFLEQCFYVFLFCLAVTVMARNMNSLESLISSARKNVNRNPVLYEQGREPSERTASRQEITAMLMHDINVDVEVDGLLIRANDHDPFTFPYEEIKGTDYLEEYGYDRDGTIRKITYTRRR